MAQGSSLSPEQAQMHQTIGAALGRIPGGVFVLTAQHEDRRAGMTVSWVQQACFEPPMVTVAVAKGKPIMPLISESRKFALCQLGEADRLTQRKFASDSEPGDDPFLGYDLRPSVLGNVPIIAQAMAFMECELSCHMDVEGDHDLFVGKIRNAAVREGSTPRVNLRDDGYVY